MKTTSSMILGLIILVFMGCNQSSNTQENPKETSYVENSAPKTAQKEKTPPAIPKI